MISVISSPQTKENSDETDLEENPSKVTEVGKWAGSLGKGACLWSPGPSGAQCQDDRREAVATEMSSLYTYAVVHALNAWCTDAWIHTLTH